MKTIKLERYVTAESIRQEMRDGPSADDGAKVFTLFPPRSGRTFAQEIVATIPTVEEIAADYDLWKAYAGMELAGEMGNYTQAEREAMILDWRTRDEPPAGPDPAAPATHQAWEEVLDARNAIQHLESKAQEYAAGLYEPEDISDADRRTMRLYILAARANLTAAERLLALV